MLQVLSLVESRVNHLFDQGLTCREILQDIRENLSEAAVTEAERYFDKLDREFQRWSRIEAKKRCTKSRS